MVIVALAWSLKAWFALTIPVVPRWRTQHQADRERVLRMEFRSFVQRFILVPAATDSLYTPDTDDIPF
jgi:hypothetical protein